MTISLIFLGLGITILCVVLFDVLITILTTDGGGPLSNNLSNSIWWILSKLKNNFSRSLPMELIGPIILVSTILAWILLTWVGWILVFSAHFFLIEQSQSEVASNFIDRLYYVGYTITTVGYGDFIAKNRLAQVASIIAGINGLSLFTLSITYSMQIITAVAEKRRLALVISSLLLMNRKRISPESDTVQSVVEQVNNLEGDIAGIAQKYLAFPIIHFFHDRSRKNSLPLKVYKLNHFLTAISDSNSLPCKEKVRIKQTQRLIRTLALNSIRHQYIPTTLMADANNVNPDYFTLDKLLFVYANSATYFETNKELV